MEEVNKPGEDEIRSSADNETKGLPPENGDQRIKKLIASYLFILAVILIIAAVMLWPAKEQVKDEVRLMLIVVIFGALGSMVHALRSFNWHVVSPGTWGTNWLLRYVLLPPTGASVALVFYAIVRAGFYSPTGEESAESLPWVIAAVAALVGMFREAATSKLKDIAQAILKKPPDPKKPEK